MTPSRLNPVDRKMPCGTVRNASAVRIRDDRGQHVSDVLERRDNHFGAPSMSNPCHHFESSSEAAPQLVYLRLSRSMPFS